MKYLVHGNILKLAPRVDVICAPRSARSHDPDEWRWIGEWPRLSQSGLATNASKAYSIVCEVWLQRKCATDLALTAVITQPLRELLIALAAQTHCCIYSNIQNSENLVHLLHMPKERNA